MFKSKTKQKTNEAVKSITASSVQKSSDEFKEIIEQTIIELEKRKNETSNVILPDNFVEAHSPPSIEFLQDIGQNPVCDSGIEKTVISSRYPSLTDYTPKALNPCGFPKNDQPAEFDDWRQEFDEATHIDFEQLEKDMINIDRDKTINAVREHPFLALGYILALPFHKLSKWLKCVKD